MKTVQSTTNPGKAQRELVVTIWAGDEANGWPVLITNKKPKQHTKTHVKRLQSIYPAGEPRGSRHWRGHRRGVRQSRFLVLNGHLHAFHRPRGRQGAV